MVWRELHWQRYRYLNALNDDTRFVVFVDSNGIARVAMDWAALIRCKRLAEWSRIPTHQTPDELN